MNNELLLGIQFHALDVTLVVKNHPVVLRVNSDGKKKLTENFNETPVADEREVKLRAV